MMNKNYEMVTVLDYVNTLDNVKCLTLDEQSIANQVEEYLLNQKRYETNAKTVESLLA